ncbi:heme exporter protein CcmB [Legionella jordanis]|uniref:Heme exporter protein B n=1 Tax=Legionella jordanis TaxID=456 RepID=A0A0W0VFH6_9GAMM|nr:heme exporter protein CcmB [Legionella jordanis]KTD18884.1 heme exporter protein CcmB [Legionella jordanis]RMX05547.1 heme exporter protein CcmB [Legionella jordanis]RMX19232.1 heme exporter protein CcmB [Legionella jordanis]VEH12984.1 heme exporter protein CcmB [Legionella jordanis]
MLNLVILFRRQFQRELLLHARQPRLLLHSSLFFLMVTVFFPLTMPPEPMLMRTVAPGLVWIAMLLALLLSSVSLFQQDYEDGVLEQWLISPYPLPVIVFAKLFVHWLLNLGAMLIYCPLLAILFHLSGYETVILVISLIVGTPAILFLCALASAFSAGRGVLMALVLLPLTVPAMVFGSASLSAAMQGLAVPGYLAILAAVSLLTVCFLPFAISAVIRISLAD